MIVLETNVISEVFRPSPNPAVIAWFWRREAEPLYTTSITLAELLYGIEIMPAGKRRDDQVRLVDRFLEVQLTGLVLPYDEYAARVYSQLLGKRKREGRPMSYPDAQIAAIVKRYDAVLATLNIRDFQVCDIELINPWEDLS